MAGNWARCMRTKGYGRNSLTRAPDRFHAITASRVLSDVQPPRRPPTVGHVAQSSAGMSSTLRNIRDGVKTDNSLWAENCAPTATQFMPVCDTKSVFRKIARSGALANCVARGLEPSFDRSGAARARSEISARRREMTFLSAAHQIRRIGRREWARWIQRRKIYQARLVSKD